MKKILIVEGNLKEENQQFTNAGIQTHTESLKDSIAYFTKNLEIDVANPSSDPKVFENIKNLEEYDGLIWGGSSLNIYNDTIEIRRQIEFMKESQKKIKKILAICWGMQVAVTAAGGEVRKCQKGTHRGIAHQIQINDNGLKHPLYKNKKNNFNTPAFNFDEVSKIPDNAILLSSNKINKVQGLNFKINECDIWGIQYHPEISYDKMIRLIHFRTDRLIEKKAFEDQKEIDNHVQMIEQENQISNKKLNVLLIVADDLNCDIGAYGNMLVKTPNIDRLASRGVVFENAHCQYPWCGPSRASLMTGLYTDQTKITANNMNLRNSVPDVISLGQRFRQQGYQSVRIGKIFHYDNPSAIGTSGNDDTVSYTHLRAHET